MFFAPLTVTDILKLLWCGITQPPPKEAANPSTQPSRTTFELKATVDAMEKPLLVVSAHDHGYREVKLHASTAILCIERGRKSLHEDHYPDELPGKGFAVTEGTKLTRVKVLLVE